MRKISSAFHRALIALVSTGVMSLVCAESHAVIPALQVTEGAPINGRKIDRQLNDVRGQVLGLEKTLIDSLRDQKQAAVRIRTLRQMITLQKQERDLSQKRLKQLEDFIAELENRRNVLRTRIDEQRGSIRKGLQDFSFSLTQRLPELPMADSETLEAPRRKVIAEVTKHRLQEVEALKADLSDSDQLETRIQEERQELNYVFQDLKEQEGVLEFHKSLQEDLLRKKHDERLTQLQHYRKLKDSEAELEGLMDQFSVRMELQKNEQAEREVSKAMFQGGFALLKGKLKLPIGGSVVSQFGRSFDAASNLFVFRKGIEIAPKAAEPVKAVAGGKVVYSGVLPSYGRVAILDHGGHYYSVVGHLGDLKRQAGDIVNVGDTLGTSDSSGQPVYFEIRARNVAVNPLQWVVN